jgi:acetoin utilization protein AcuC
MGVAYIYSDRYGDFDYGSFHPLRNERLSLTRFLTGYYGLLDGDDIVLEETRKATDDEVAVFHSRAYLDVLKAADGGMETVGFYHYGLGSGDNPVFQGLYQWSLLSAGASIQAARLVDSGTVSLAFNIAGGLHHAHREKASGFCYINDPAVIIAELVNNGRRVAYLDIDAHHGDGVQWGFYDNPRVLTISLHESGKYLFPGTGGMEETGKGEGEGYSVNVPLIPGCDDEVFLHAFNEVVPPFIDRFRPDILVAQLGVDTFKTDPLSHLELTTSGFLEAVKVCVELCPKLVALGGGGYNVDNVARAWTLAWGVMCGVEPQNELPPEYGSRLGPDVRAGGTLRDAPLAQTTSNKDLAMSEARKTTAYLLEKVLPLVKSDG